ncbi:MAG: adenosylcobinamide-GDP ribazoletransferase [Lachnospiraceae bacterium]|nr:adenosylcobinamide-GDP ribazoletransferase [Lachnospiraceae bacterium]
MKGFIIAFSMYSKIPMPKLEWTKENMKYAICYFPLIGAVIGLISYGAYSLFNVLGAGDGLRASILVVLPLLVTGGIHMDGFLDTSDALNSYGDREKKLAILKDPNAGAFAVIRGFIYMFLLFGLFSEADEKSILLAGIGYVYSRAYSGLSVVSFQNARGNGTLAAFSQNAEKKRVQLVMIGYLLLSAGLFLMVDMVAGAACMVAGAGVFLYYKKMSYAKFGGITGDLAGYFVELCELAVLAAAVMVQLISAMI